jgi:LuxR family maltose regulon positive regulatory protein
MHSVEIKYSAAPLAKISRPVSNKVIYRARQFELIDELREQRIIWVAAPAGSGKTTLISSYIKQRELPCLWYQLDDTDADIASFFYFLSCAAAKAVPHKRVKLPLLSAEYSTGLATFVRNYFQQLFEVLPNGTLLVFDDYHELAANSPLQEIIQQGLSLVPEQYNVVIISRTDPPPLLARSRANGVLATIQWQDLKFSEQECFGVAELQMTSGRKPTRQVVRQLCEKSHGWAAGLILLLEQVNAANPLPKDLDEYDHEGIFDYFAEEVFKKTEEKIQDFLLKTAFLVDIIPAAAAKLTGIDNAGRILSMLNRHNYFTQKHAHKNPVYQYHPLFRHFLLERGREVFSAPQRKKILLSAAELLDAERRNDEAAHLYCEALCWEKLIDLIIRYASVLVDQGRHSTLESWLNLLPPHLQNDNPELLLWRGACQLPYAPAESRYYLQQAYVLFQQAGQISGKLKAWSMIVESIVLEWSDLTLLDKWVDELEAFLVERPVFPNVELEARIVSGMLTALVLRRPSNPSISTWAQRLKSIVTKINDVGQRLLLGCSLYRYYGACLGEMHQAQNTLNLIRPVSPCIELDPLVWIMWYQNESHFHWLRWETDRADQAVKAGLQTAEESGVRIYTTNQLATAVYCSLSRGDTAQADQYLKTYLAHMNPKHGMEVAEYHLMATWAALVRRDAIGARHHVDDAVQLIERFGGPAHQALAQIALASVLHEECCYHAAMKASEHAEAISTQIQSPYLHFVSLLYSALSAARLADEPKCRECLQNAFEIGQRQNYMNFMFWRSDIMTELCAKALELNIEVQYVHRLIGCRQLTPMQPSHQLENWPWRIRIYTLGRFSVVKEGEPILFSGKAQRRPMEMLKVLIALGGRDIKKERIQEILWPDSEEDAAHSSFTSTLSRLRKLIGNDVVTIQDGRVNLNPLLCWVDAWVFERLLGQAGNGQVADNTLNRIVDMYQGQFLAGDLDEAWLLPRREKLRSKFLRFVLDRARSYEFHGQHDKAITLYKKGLEVDELAEALYRGLMQCYIALGRYAGAVKVYQQCERILHNMLGVQPAKETQALFLSIKPKITKD